jgi:hypothetical protein
MSIDEKAKEVLAPIGKVKASRKPHSPAECQIIDEFQAEGVKEEDELEDEEEDDEEFEEWERERNEDDA